MKPVSPFVCVISYRRSGTHLTLDLLRHNFKAIYPDHLFVPEAITHNPDRFSDDSEKIAEILYGCQIPLFKTHLTHMEPPEGETLPPEILYFFQRIFMEAALIYVARDPRDVFTSYYHYLRRLGDIPEDMPFSDFIRQTDRIKDWCAHIDYWMDQPGITLLRYEDILTDPAPSMARCAEVIGLPAPKTVKMIPIEAKESTATDFIRHPDSSATLPRKGIVGDYKNHFSQDDLAFFMPLVERSMKKLGYQTD